MPAQSTPLARNGPAVGPVARVRLWEHEVGAVLELADGRVVFEYRPSFRASGLEISPVHLPRSRVGPVEFPALRRLDAFQGLPGVLADALPDAFGNAVIRRYFEQKGTPAASLSPVQRLLYIGNRAMGALAFAPAMERGAHTGMDEALDIARLVEQSRHVVEGNPEVAIPEMMALGASAGGARAKALVLWDPGRARIRSAFATHEPGESHWMIKFDGVSAGGGGNILAGDFRPGPFGRIEYAYSRMARSAGIEMPPTHLLEERAFGHFLVERFDRRGAERLHLHTLGGMLHVDYNQPGLLGYEDLFRTIRRLGLGQGVIDQAYRRMVFNVVARNQDDHVKNVAFLMTSDGTWRLAPAYDVTWACGSGWTRVHQMTIRGRNDGFTRRDLVEVADEWDVRGAGRQIVEEVLEAVAQWPAEAVGAGVPSAMMEEIGRSFRQVG